MSLSRRCLSLLLTLVALMLSGCANRGGTGSPGLAEAQQRVRDAQGEAEVARRYSDLFVAQKYAEAATLYEARIAEAGLNTNRLTMLCLAYEQMGEFGKLEGCSENFGKLLSNKPPAVSARDATAAQLAQSETEQAYFHWMRILQNLGDFNTLTTVGARGAAIASGSMRMLMLQQVGDAWVKLGQPAKARQLREEIAAWNPEQSERAAFRARHGSNSALKSSEDMTVNVAIGAKLTALQLISMYLGESDAALRYFDQNRAHEKAWQPPRPTDPKLLASYHTMDASMAMTRGNLLLNLNRPADARREFERATSLAPNLNQTLWQLQFDLGRIEEGENRPQAAIPHYKRAIDIIEAQRGTLGGEGARIDFVGNKQDVYARLVGVLIKTGAIASAFEYAERGKSRAMVDLLASRAATRAVASGGAAEAHAKLLADLRNAELAATRAEQKDAEQQRKTRSVVLEASNRLKSAAPELAALVAVSHSSAPELQGLLKADETLVEFFGGGKQLVAFIANRQRIRAVSIEPDVLGRIADYRKALQNPESKDAMIMGRKLYAALIEPLGLPARGSLTIVPHGALHYLPFAALGNERDTLLDRFSLRVLPSASIMPLLMKRTAPTNRNTLIVGNPDLGDKEYDLPGAQKEAEEIARLRPGSKLLLRSEATREAVTSAGPQYAYLHFASHGTFDTGKPRASGLLLANKPGARDATEGMLTVDELYGLRLNADLVTLSACETALADIQNGDDLIGLSRGFFFAGANNIVSSLWQVDDTATEMMMVQFYKLLPTLPKADALRRAQLAVKAKFPHPFYWAAFQLTGADAGSARPTR